MYLSSYLRHNTDCCSEGLVLSVLYYFKFKLIFGVGTEILYSIKFFIKLVLVPLHIYIFFVSDNQI